MAPADHLTDAQIVTQVLTGTQTRYRLLVERHQRAVFNAAYRLLGDQEEATDVTQDTFLRAYQALATFQRDRPLAPWLCRIAINLAINRLKQRRPTVSLDQDWPVFNQVIPDLSSEPQANLLRSERRQAIRQAILELSHEQRAVIELRHFQGYSYQEIASQLKLSLSSVKSHLFRARKKLRLILEEEP